MDADVLHEGVSVIHEGVSVDEFNTMEPEEGSSRVDILDGISLSEEVNGELGKASEVLTRIELDLACSSEKLANLSVLAMHVATRETDFELFLSEKNFILVDSVEKALEFDLLYGVLDSEVRELDKFMVFLETDITSSRDTILSCKYLGETFLKMDGKLLDSEEYLKQLRCQVSEIKAQSDDFRRVLSCLHGNKNSNDENGVNLLEADQSSSADTNIKLQTVDQKRHVLRMLEGSLARELDLEKNLAESRNTEEELKPRLLALEQEIIYMEKEAIDINERLFEAENAGEVFMGISKELLGQLHLVQFNLNSSTHREAELRSKLKDYTEKLESKESTLQKLNSSDIRVSDFLVAQTDSLKAKLMEAENKFILADSEAFTLREKIALLQKQLKESEFNLLSAKASVDGHREQYDALCSEVKVLENVVADLKDKLSRAENRADNAESKCKLLGEANMELNEELVILKGQSVSSDKLEALEKQLKESEIQLLNAMASAEASQEKQSMLYSTIGDMENLIEDLKLKVSKSENRADSAEDKCIILSETNAELSEELSFLRGRLGCLEASLNQAEEMKMETARDIGIRTKLITSLLVQLGKERERLHQQISGLALENKILVVKLKQKEMDSTIIGSHENRDNVDEFLFSKQDGKEEIIKSSASGSELDKSTESVGESDVRPADVASDYENVRSIDARLLTLKHISLALLILLIAAGAYYFQKQGCSFY